MRLRVDVELQNVARLAPGRPGLALAAIGHHEGDFVIVGMNVLLHSLLLLAARQMAALVNVRMRWYIVNHPVRQARIAVGTVGSAGGATFRQAA